MNSDRQLIRTDLSNPFKTIGPLENPVVENLIKRFTKGLFIDNRNIADPIVTPEFFETQQRGEIRYMENDFETPFHPNPMRTSNDSHRMLYLYGSEYLFNSLLYHAYEDDRLIVEIDENLLSPQYKSLVRTTCNEVHSDNVFKSMCLGKLIPEIEKIDQIKLINLNYKLIVELFNYFTTNNNITARLLMYVKGELRRRQILVSSAHLQADLRFIIQDEKFAAILKLNKFIARLHRSAIEGVNSDTITQLTPLAKTFIGPYLARALRKGLPFPLKDSVRFINPVLRIHDGFAELATDFRLGERNLREKIKKAFNENFEKI
ncbi:unnamed protein product [Dracunculus medinensis]|uniref:BPI2 domain-containing protein n=1 Tax=Dracunculus medinensis TaxID=318479 RepID=A0A0N4ULT7_DRAME|nr:unnamed protein product [Dracunculus medinensis]